MLKGKVVVLREKQFPLLLLTPSIITISLTVYLNSTEVKSLTKGRCQMLKASQTTTYRVN